MFLRKCRNKEGIGVVDIGFLSDLGGEVEKVGVIERS